MAKAVQKYMRVAKPGIILGNLISAAGGYFFASHGSVDFGLLLPTLIGICMVVASGCVFNNFIDRDTDRQMARTRGRVLVRGGISLPAAVVYASLLGALGTALLWSATNLLTVAIVLAGFIIYVVLYSLFLKRTSVYGTLIGSLAGAAPPLAGYCAASGCFDAAAIILLLIFSLWQMPHCYAIAIYRLDDYVAAAIPVLPAKLEMPAVKKHIFGYTVAFVAATLMPTFGGYAGYGYLATAAALGLYWLYLVCSGFKTSQDRLWAKKLFVFSIVNISILSIVMSIDCAVSAGSGMLLPGSAP